MMMRLNRVAAAVAEALRPHVRAFYGGWAGPTG